ncbi:MAG: putative PEP-binding protein, partial [Candidatus Omnitrophota bacterium]
PTAAAAVPAIRKRLEDKSAIVRKEAQNALEKIQAGPSGRTPPDGGTAAGILLLAVITGIIYKLAKGFKVAPQIPAPMGSGIAVILILMLGAMLYTFFADTDSISRGAHEDEPSGRAWPRFSPSDSFRGPLFKILREMYPGEKDFKKFIREFESNRVPDLVKKRMSKTVEASQSLLPYYFKITDAYTLFKIHQKQKDREKMHFYMYNPQDIDRRRATLVVIAGDNRPTLLSDAASFISRSIPKIIGHETDIDIDWNTIHNGGEKTLLYFEIRDLETGRALTEEQIEKVYRSLPGSMIGVQKKDLRTAAEEAMKKVLHIAASPKRGKKKKRERQKDVEVTLTGLKTGRDRVAEGYVYRLPKIDTSIVDERICVPWDSSRLANLKIGATVFDLERALEKLLENHTEISHTGIGVLVHPIAALVERVKHPNRKSAMQRVLIICKDIVTKTMHAGKKARKIRHVLSERIEKEASQYDNINADMASEIRQLGDELLKGFMENREAIGEEEVLAEQRKLDDTMERVKKNLEEMLESEGASAQDKDLYLNWVLKDISDQTKKMIAAEKTNAAASLLKVIKKTEGSLEKMKDPKFISIVREVVNTALLALGRLEVQISLNGFMRDPMVEMEKVKLRDNLAALRDAHKQYLENRGSSPYSGDFIAAVEAMGEKKVEEGKTATKAVIEIMNEMIQGDAEITVQEKTRIEATTDVIVETLDSIKLLDDTDVGDGPLVIATNSLDIYRVPKLFKESTRVTAIIADEDHPASHWVGMANNRVPTLTSTRSARGEPATAVVKTGDRVIVNERTGTVYVNPGLQTEEAMDMERAGSVVLRREAERRKYDPAKTIDEAEATFAIDVTEPLNLQKALSCGFKDIGLLRTEMLYQDVRPGKEELAKLFKRIADSTEGIVTIRMFDMQRDKKPKYLPDSGFQGTAYLLEDETGKDIAGDQVWALVKAYHGSERHNIRILFPNVFDPEEAKAARYLVGSAEQTIRDEKYAEVPESPAAIKVGGMIESVEAVENREGIIGIFDFISIGTNDLINSIKGYKTRKGALSAKDTMVPPDFDVHVASVFESTSRAGKELCLCGEWINYPKIMFLLLNVAKKYPGKIVLTAEPDRVAVLMQLARAANVGDIAAAVEPLREDPYEFDGRLEEIEDTIRENTIIEIFEAGLQGPRNGAEIRPSDAGTGRMPGNAGAARVSVIVATVLAAPIAAALVIALAGGMGKTVAILSLAAVGLCAGLSAAAILYLAVSDIVKSVKEKGHKALVGRMIEEFKDRVSRITDPTEQDMGDALTEVLLHAQDVHGIGVITGPVYSGLMNFAEAWREKRIEEKVRGERTAAVVIGVVGISSKTASKVSARIGGVKVVALNENSHEKNIRLLEKFSRDYNAFGRGIIDREGLTEKEVLNIAEELVSAIEKEDRKIFALAHPEIIGLDDENIKRIKNAGGVLRRIVDRMPVIRSFRASELSVYNMRMSAFAENHTTRALSPRIAEYVRNSRIPKMVSIGAGSLGEVKLLAETHRRRMEQMGYRDPKDHPVKLQIRLAMKDIEMQDGTRVKLEDSAGVKQSLLERMEIDDVLNAGDLVLVDEAAANTQTVGDIYKNIKGYDAKNVAIVEKVKENRSEDELPSDDIVFVEYEGLATSLLYDAVLTLMADDKQSPFLSSLKERHGNKRVWHFLPRAAHIDTKELREEIKRYEAFIMAA